MIPELLWIALVQDKFGIRRGVEIITEFTHDVRASHSDRANTVWAAAGKFEVIPRDELRHLVDAKATAYGNDLRAALQPLATWYPEHPLNSIFGPKQIPAAHADLAQVRAIVAEYFDRSSYAATMTQATAIWLVFDADRLKVAAHSSLAQFPSIEEYPETELSRTVAASIRATLNVLFGFGEAAMLTSGSKWPVAFWNQGLKLEPCEFNG